MNAANGWRLVPLGSVVRKSEDRVAVEVDREYPNFGIYSFGRGLFAKQPIRGSASSATGLFRAKSNQFVYSRLFAFEGAYGVVNREFDGHFVSNEFPLFDCDPTQIVPGYLQWFFRNHAIWPEIARLTTGMGNRRQRLKPESFLTYRIPIPPLEEQQRIVTRVDTLAEQCNEVSRIRKGIEADTRAMLLAVFDRIVDGSPRLRMAEVAPVVRRRINVCAGTVYPELGIRSFGKGTFHKPSLDFLEVGSKKLYQIEPGDLVFNNVFAWEGAIAVAKKEDEGRVGSHRFITCVPLSGVATAEFLCFYFLTPDGLQRIGDASPGGALRNRTLGLEKLMRIDVPIPDVASQNRFNRFQNKVREMLATQHDAKMKLDLILPSVLDRAFKGVL